MMATKWELEEWVHKESTCMQFCVRNIFGCSQNMGFLWLLFVSLFAFWLDLGSVKSEPVFLLGLAYMIQPTKVKQLK